MTARVFSSTCSFKPSIRVAIHFPVRSLTSITSTNVISSWVVILNACLTFEVQVAVTDFFVNAILAACVECAGAFFAEDLFFLTGIHVSAKHALYWQNVLKMVK